MISGSLIESQKISGRIFSKKSLKGTLVTNGKLNGRIFTSNVVKGSLKILENYDDYSGDYIFTPTIEGETVNTNDKHLTGDLHIKPIPMFEVSNEQGGTTIIIGG